MFYQCDAGNCKRKYKTWPHFDEHLKIKHGKKRNDKDDYIQIGAAVETHRLVKAYEKKILETIRNAPKSVAKPIDDIVKPLGDNETSLCSICYDAKCDTVVVPCGHLAYCHACISEYHTKNLDKGCPLCNKEILLITRVYTQ